MLPVEHSEGHEQQQQQQQQTGQRVSTPQTPATPDQTEHFARQSNLVTLLRQSLPQCLPQQPQRQVWRCLMDYPRESPLTCTVPARPLDISLEEAQLLLESFWLSAAPKPCTSGLMESQPLSKFAQHLLQIEATDAEAARHFFLSDAEFFQRESCGSRDSYQPGSPPVAAHCNQGNQPYHSHANDEEWEWQAGWEDIAWTPGWRLLLQLLLCTSCLRAAQPCRSGRSSNVSQPSSSRQRHAAKVRAFPWRAVCIELP